MSGTCHAEVKLLSTSALKQHTAPPHGVLIAGPLGLPYVLLMAVLRLKPSLVKYWALGWLKSIRDISNGASLSDKPYTGS